VSRGRAQLVNLGWTKPWGVTLVNELHFSYMRDANKIGQPVGGVGPTLASQGFIEGAGTLGIVPLNPSVEGIESVSFNDFTFGVDVTGERQVNNTYQGTESLSKVVGKHTLKFGTDFHLDQVNINSNSINNGAFVFQGTETGLDIADYLIGVASTYEQGDASGFYIRNKYTGIFAQDSWQARSNLTMNYGVLGYAAAVAGEVQPVANFRSGPAVGGLSRRSSGNGVSRRPRRSFDTDADQMV
jgi:hypothetical protein